MCEKNCTCFVEMRVQYSFNGAGCMGMDVGTNFILVWWGGAAYVSKLPYYFAIWAFMAEIAFIFQKALFYLLAILAGYRILENIYKGEIHHGQFTGTLGKLFGVLQQAKMFG